MKIHKGQPLKKASFSLKEQRPRLLIADDDTTFARALSDYFTGVGFDCRIVYTVAAAREIVEFWQPEIVMVDLMLPHTNAVALLKFMNSKPLVVKPRVIMMFKDPKSTDTVKRLGVAGYLLKPFQFEDALRVLRAATGSGAPTGNVVGPKSAPSASPKLILTPPAPKGEKKAAIPPTSPRDKIDPVTKAVVKELHLVDLLLKQALDTRKPNENLFNLMRMLSMKVRAARCSFIRFVNAETGIVMATNDDPTIRGLPIQLKKYPEILEVVRTQQVLIVPDVSSSPIMAPVVEAMKHTKFETIAVFPIFIRSRFFGVTSLRMERRSETEIVYVDNFGKLAAQILSVGIVGHDDPVPKESEDVA